MYNNAYHTKFRRRQGSGRCVLITEQREDVENEKI